MASSPRYRALSEAASHQKLLRVSQKAKKLNLIILPNFTNTDSLLELVAVLVAAFHGHVVPADVVEHEVDLRHVKGGALDLFVEGQVFDLDDLVAAALILRRLFFILFWRWVCCVIRKGVDEG